MVVHYYFGGFMDKLNQHSSCSRRTFLKGASVGLAAVAADISLPFNVMASTESIAAESAVVSEEKLCGVLVR